MTVSSFEYMFLSRQSTEYLVAELGHEIEQRRFISGELKKCGKNSGLMLDLKYTMSRVNCISAILERR